MLQFQLRFPLDGGKTRNRMEFPGNSSSPWKLSINKYSGLDPNRESREGGEGTKILIKGSTRLLLKTIFEPLLKFIKTSFYSALAHSAFCETFSYHSH